MTAATLALPRARPVLSLGHAAGAGSLIGLAVSEGGSATGLSPTTTIITGLITTVGAVLMALIARIPLGRRRRSEPEPDGDVATVPLDAYLAMRDQLQHRIDELEAQLHTARRHR